MRYLIFLLILCSSIVLAQSENDQVDSVRTTTISSGGLYPNKIIEIYTGGSWKRIGSAIPAVSVAGLSDSLSARGLPSVSAPTGKFLRDDHTWQTVTSGSPTASLFEIDLNGNLRPIAGTDTDLYFEIDSFGNIRPKP